MTISLQMSCNFYRSYSSIDDGGKKDFQVNNDSMFLYDSTEVHTSKVFISYINFSILTFGYSSVIKLMCRITVTARDRLIMLRDDVSSIEYTVSDVQ